MNKEAVEAKLKQYLTLLEITDNLLSSIGGGLLKSQTKAVNGMYDTFDREAREMHKDHVPFLRKELKKLNRLRKNDLRLLNEAYAQNSAFNKMILKNFKIESDKEKVEKINKLFV